MSTIRISVEAGGELAARRSAHNTRHGDALRPRLALLQSNGAKQLLLRDDLLFRTFVEQSTVQFELHVRIYK